jgi:transposase
VISGHRRPRTSLIAARVEPPFAAPVLFEGTCNTALFNAWLEQQLCPLLHAQQVVVRDNVSFHKSAKTQALLHATGASLLFLPPYSPDLNPIEHDFATLTRLREYNEHESLDTLVKTYKYQGA